jgi:hypothetical protein
MFQVEYQHIPGPFEVQVNGATTYVLGGPWPGVTTYSWSIWSSRVTGATNISTTFARWRNNLQNKHIYNFCQVESRVTKQTNIQLLLGGATTYVLGGPWPVTTNSWSIWNSSGWSHNLCPRWTMTSDNIYLVHLEFKGNKTNISTTFAGWRNNLCPRWTTIGRIDWVGFLVHFHKTVFPNHVSVIQSIQFMSFLIFIIHKFVQFRNSYNYQQQIY